MSACLGLEVLILGSRLCFGTPESDLGAAVVTRCPPLKEYSENIQELASREMRALPVGSAVAGLVADYGTLRKKCRAYEGSGTK